VTKVVCVLRNDPVPDCWFVGRPVGKEYPIVDGGKLAVSARVPAARPTPHAAPRP
jgi:hypothetical protein